MSNYMPRWIIYGIDLAIVMLAFFSLWTFRDTIAVEKGVYMWYKLAIVVLIFGATSIIFRTYHGVEDSHL
ncbi:MAG: hypothetical protein U1D64_03725 [Bacteroidales bacterium]|nr:hypothetical protein [Bacteroidales bacterium]